MKQMSTDGKPDRSAMHKMMENTQAQVTNVLDDKQKVEFQKMQDERKKGMQRSGDKPDSKPAPKTDTQKSE